MTKQHIGIDSREMPLAIRRPVQATSALQGKRQALPPSHWPAQMPTDNGAQTVPGGNPSAAQSASRAQSAQFSSRLMNFAQAMLPAVVRKQRHSAPLLQVSAGGGSIEQISGPPCLQVPVSWARHLRLPFFPSQIPEQHWSARLHRSPTPKQPKRFGLGFFFVPLRFFLASAPAGSRAAVRPSPMPVRPRRTSRRDGIAVKTRIMRSKRFSTGSTVFPQNPRQARHMARLPGASQEER